MIIYVKGSELSLLKSIDFKFPIFCIIIEAHSGDSQYFLLIFFQVICDSNINISHF